jgi:uncharacterized LabA/DUF88 family protein
MRVCVFVDGENLRHTICDLYEPVFDRREYLPKTAEWAKFYDLVVERATGGEGKRMRTYWYVVEHFDAYPSLLSKSKRTLPELSTWAIRHEKLLRAIVPPIPANGTARDERLAELHNELLAKLEVIRTRFDGFTTLQNGIVQKHRALEFRRSGAIPYNLIDGRFGQEKTVDVHLAVDMVTLQANYDLAIIVSGDQDYVPAAQSVKDMGKHVVNVAFKARSGVLLPGGAKRLNQATDWSITLEWEEFRVLLGIPAVLAPPA